MAWWLGVAQVLPAFSSTGLPQSGPPLESDPPRAPGNNHSGPAAGGIRYLMLPMSGM